MNKGKSAISILLFSVYALVLCHTFIPHFHSNNSLNKVVEQIEELPDHSHDHSSHSHHHSHSANNSETLFDYLLGLLSDLGHKDQGEHHLEELLVENNVHQTNLVKQDAAVQVTPLFYCLQTEIISFKERAEIYIRPPILYEQLCSSSESLRGPPSI